MAFGSLCIQERSGVGFAKETQYRSTVISVQIVSSKEPSPESLKIQIIVRL